MTVDRVNYINIGLMVASLVMAFILPFELFLFSYAFLGPAHYLTEISWLNDKQYFLKNKFDYLPLVFIALAIFIGSSYVGKYQIEFLGDYYFEMIFFAFGFAFVFFLIKDWAYRLFGLMVVAAIAMVIGASHKNGEATGMYLIFGLYLPTLIHVYLFTGAFILFGALKGKSKSGYLSFLIFILCPIACFVFFTNPTFYHVSGWAEKYYTGTFDQLSLHVMNNFAGGVPEGLSMKTFFSNPTSIMVGRFIAFAYTYHYLNWFSKTSIIKWHDVSKLRFIAVVILWVASVALYMKDYMLGFTWLFFLSFAHVLLEFPLNHHSFIGIGKEVIGRFSSAKPTGRVPAGKK